MTSNSYNDALARYRRGEIDKDQLRQSVSGSSGRFMDWPRPPFYDKHGEPMSEVEWCERSKSRSYQQIVYTKLQGRKAVLTIWLGYDMNPWRKMSKIETAVIDFRPKIFETRLLVFGKLVEFPSWFSFGLLSGWHWATEGEALAGHHEVCHAYRHNRRWRRRYLPRLSREEWERLIW
jgi:hypothetical protein